MWSSLSDRRGNEGEVFDEEESPTIYEFEDEDEEFDEEDILLLDDIGPSLSGEGLG